MDDKISLSIMLDDSQSKAAHDFLAALTYPAKKDGTVAGPPPFIMVTDSTRAVCRYVVIHFAFHPGGPEGMHPGKVVIEAVAAKLSVPTV